MSDSVLIEKNKVALQFLSPLGDLGISLSWDNLATHPIRRQVGLSVELLLKLNLTNYDGF